ncbi:unnamed protein product [Leptidea sinapis]|uniref:CAAX prenyl protease 2 n=2 Tax=Leptidea sinapis TaxID=189913 RepID=A0A5E4Q0K0_9NEOP|nr:unnamed protein product [Leptidea sinapis]
MELINHNSCFSSVLACVFLTICYVGSLYVWRSKESRDHPSTIKKRCFSVFVMMLLAPIFTQYFLSDPSDIYEKMGLRETALFKALLLPLLLTATLFLGPLTMQFFSGGWWIYLEPMFWISCWQDLVWVRNHIMAPLSEEWVFRACMMPILLQCLSPMTAVFVGPILFGIAHFHHMLEQIKGGCEVKTALIISSEYAHILTNKGSKMSCFQFTYTTIFGAYSSYLFVISSPR